MRSHESRSRRSPPSSHRGTWLLLLAAVALVALTVIFSPARGMVGPYF